MDTPPRLPGAVASRAIWLQFYKPERFSSCLVGGETEAKTVQRRALSGSKVHWGFGPRLAGAHGNVDTA